MVEFAIALNQESYETMRCFSNQESKTPERIRLAIKQGTFTVRGASNAAKLNHFVQLGVSLKSPKRESLNEFVEYG